MAPNSSATYLDARSDFPFKEPFDNHLPTNLSVKTMISIEEQFNNHLLVPSAFWSSYCDNESTFYWNQPQHSEGNRKRPKVVHFGIRSELIICCCCFSRDDVRALYFVWTSPQSPIYFSAKWGCENYGNHNGNNTSPKQPFSLCSGFAALIFPIAENSGNFWFPCKYNAVHLYHVRQPEFVINTILNILMSNGWAGWPSHPLAFIWQTWEKTISSWEQKILQYLQTMLSWELGREVIIKVKQKIKILVRKFVFISSDPWLCHWPRIHMTNIRSWPWHWPPQTWQWGNALAIHSYPLPLTHFY